MLSLVDFVMARTKSESKSHMPMATKEAINPYFLSLIKPKAPTKRKRDKMISGAAKALYTAGSTGIVEGNAFPTNFASQKMSVVMATKKITTEMTITPRGTFLESRLNI